MARLKKDPTHYWIRAMEFGAGLGCHQMPERSFFVKGYQFPVCARCTGVIAGEALFFLLLLLRVRISLPLSLLLLVPMGLDWGIQYLKLLSSTNARRFITGLLGGLGLTNLYWIALVALFRAIR